MPRELVKSLGATITVAIIASVVTVTALTGYSRYSYLKKRRALARQVQDQIRQPPTQPPIDDDGYDEDLIREFLTRNYAFYGDDAMRKIRDSTVVVVGCGGVGSWAALMLLRSGVSNIRLIDFDNVTLSSLNRHACATLADVGTPKVSTCKAFFSRIAPWAKIDIHIQLWNDTPDGHSLLNNVDWVIDAIDNITTKVDLLAYCHSQKIPVFASMGAGAKCDPTRVQISDISNTQEDPLARSVRRRLRLKGVVEGIPVVYSTEVPSDVKLLPLPEDEVLKGAVHELGPLDDFRVRILPVIGPLPSIFGLHAATYILCSLAGQPIPHPLPVKNRWKLYEKLLKDLAAREAKLNPGGLHRKLPIDEGDVAYIFEDLHSGRSIVPPHPILAKPHLVRWDISRPLSVENSVVLSASDIRRLEAAGGIGEKVAWWNGDAGEADAVSGQVVAKLVRRRQEEARQRMALLY